MESDNHIQQQRILRQILEFLPCLNLAQQIIR